MVAPVSRRAASVASHVWRVDISGRWKRGVAGRFARGGPAGQDEFSRGRGAHNCLELGRV